MDLTGKQVLVAGLGKSGIAAGALLKKMGCMVCLFDGNEKFDRSAWEKNISCIFGLPVVDWRTAGCGSTGDGTCSGKSRNTA